MRLLSSIACLAVCILCSVALADDLVNGDFEDGLTGWTTGGQVHVTGVGDNNVAYLGENPTGAVSYLYQEFDLPEHATTIQFRCAVIWMRGGKTGQTHGMVPVFRPMGDFAVTNPQATVAPKHRELPKLIETARAKGTVAPSDSAQIHNAKRDLSPLSNYSSRPRGLNSTDHAEIVDVGQGSKLESVIERYIRATESFTLGHPNDAFMAFLVDPDSLARLLPPPGEPPLLYDDFFHFDNEASIDFNSDYVTLVGPDTEGIYTVILDVSSLPAQRSVRLEFGLAGGPDGLTTIAAVDDVIVTLGNTQPTALCQNATLQAGDACCSTVSVQNIDAGSYDPDGADDIASICITEVEGQLVDCLQSVDLCGLGDYAVTLTITDNAGEYSSCVASVAVEDSSPPLLVVPPDSVLECDQSTAPDATGEATATDNCGTATVSFEDAIVPGNCAQEYLIVRTWTATDEAGNSDSSDQMISIVDTTPPLIVVPPDITIECDQPADPSMTGVAIATDNCGEAVVSHSDALVEGACNNEFTILRLWTATDECGNSDSAEQVINVVDTTPPTISPVEDQTIECDQPAIPPDVSANDNCPGLTLRFEEQRIDGNCPNAYELHRTWRAVDDCGNEDTISQIVSVVDTTPPVLECPADVTISCATEEGVLVDGVTLEAIAWDNCSDSVVILDDRPIDFFPIGTTTVTFTAEDECGLSDSCQTQVTVTDDCLSSLEIDVYPGTYPNTIVLSRDYTIYVVAFATADFDPFGDDVDTVRFGPIGTEAEPVAPPYPVDFNDDGLDDALFGFRTFNCYFHLGDEAATISFEMNDGSIVRGVDSVHVVP